MKEMYGLKAVACPSAMNRLSPCSTGDSCSDLIRSMAHCKNRLASIRN